MGDDKVLDITAGRADSGGTTITIIKILMNDETAKCICGGQAISQAGGTRLDIVCPVCDAPVKSDLKPCPKCGSPAELVHTDHHANVWQAKCTVCYHNSQARTTTADAVAGWDDAWNWKRPTPQPDDRAEVASRLNHLCLESGFTGSGSFYEIASIFIINDRTSREQPLRQRIEELEKSIQKSSNPIFTPLGIGIKFQATAKCTRCGFIGAYDLTTKILCVTCLNTDLTPTLAKQIYECAKHGCYTITPWEMLSDDEKIQWYTMSRFVFSDRASREQLLQHKVNELSKDCHIKHLNYEKLEQENQTLQSNLNKLVEAGRLCRDAIQGYKDTNKLADDSVLNKALQAIKPLLTSLKTEAQEKGGDMAAAVRAPAAPSVIMDDDDAHLADRAKPLKSDCDEDEDLIQQCIEVIRCERTARISLLQRRLRLGYTRAARIMDELESRGIVGPAKGGKIDREILIELPKP